MGGKRIPGHPPGGSPCPAKFLSWPVINLLLGCRDERECDLDFNARQGSSTSEPVSSLFDHLTAGSRRLCCTAIEREGDRKPVILRGHFSEHNKHWLLCLTVCLFSDLLLGLSDWKWHWSHNILDYGYFCITLHSWEIPAVWLHHHSGAGSQVLYMLFRVCG